MEDRAAGGLMEATEALLTSGLCGRAQGGWSLRSSKVAEAFGLNSGRGTCGSCGKELDLCIMLFG